MSEPEPLVLQIAVTGDDVEVLKTQAANMGKTTEIFMQEHVAAPIQFVLKNMLDQFRRNSARYL